MHALCKCFSSHVGIIESMDVGCGYFMNRLLSAILAIVVGWGQLRFQIMLIFMEFVDQRQVIL